MRHILPLLLLTVLPACGTYVQKPTTLDRQPVLAYAPLEDSGQFDRLSDADRAVVDGLLQKLPPNTRPVFTVQVNRAELLSDNERLNELAYYLGQAWPTAEVKLTLVESPHALGVQSRYMVLPVPETCPDWRPAGIVNQEDSLASHIGCATVNNLHLQVADPNDLAHGRSRPEADTQSAARAVERHYSGEIMDQHFAITQNSEGSTGEQ